MRWKVEIAGPVENDRLLRDVLQQLSIDVLDESNPSGRFLVSSTFEACASAGEVFEIATNVREVIDEVGTHDAELAVLRFALGRVCEQRTDGTWNSHTVIRVAPAVLTISGAAAAMMIGTSAELSEAERIRIEEEQREQTYQQLRRKAVSRIVPSLRDERARQVQQLLQAEMTVDAMWKIVELIQADLGGGIKTFVSANALSRFGGSVNHPKVFGKDARHAVSREDPPPKPMGRAEARSFVRGLATRWLEYKAGL